MDAFSIKQCSNVKYLVLKLEDIQFQLILHGCWIYGFDNLHLRVSSILDLNGEYISKQIRLIH